MAGGFSLEDTAAMFSRVDWWWWGYHPVAVVAWCILVFAPLRLAVGGANYLPSRAWYMLCFIIPCFVLAGILPSAFCIPLWADPATGIHLIAALVYIQLDLLVVRFFLMGPEISTFGLPCLLWDKFSFLPQTLDGLTPPGVPPLARAAFELNGSLLHEIFWNVFVCQNCIDHGLPRARGPGHPCRARRLLYHASGSVLVPGLIHAMWYLTEAKLSFALRSTKRNWDADERTAEAGTPPWDRTCTVGVILIVSFYVPLNIVSHMHADVLRSGEGLLHAEAGCRAGELPRYWIERVLILAGLVQVAVGVLTWGQVRAGMDLIAETGDLTDRGIEAVAGAMERYNQEHTGFRPLFVLANSAAPSA